MSVGTLLLVLLGGAVGAPVRHLVDRWVSARVGGAVPWGTLVVNVAGCFLLGLLVAAAPRWLVDLAGVGFCGALTTFSTFSAETVRLLEEGRPLPATAHVLGSVLLGLAAATLGWWVG